MESTNTPAVKTVSETVDVAGIFTYHGASADYLLVAHDEEVDVYDDGFVQKGTIPVSGIERLSIEGGISVYQGSSSGYSSGALALAFEGEDSTGVAVGPLDGVLAPLGIETNTKYDPRISPCNNCQRTISEKCSFNGYRGDNGSCQCFAGFTGRDCSQTNCKNGCSGNGRCTGPNTCSCRDGWQGPDCSFVAVKPKYETAPNGGDGDDPAIWIHPINSNQSRIVTTTKSEAGAGFAVFDLKGNLLQHTPAEEPNNVDVIYNFTVGSRTTDLTFAACRGDNTLW
jgi:3-phytase